MRRIASLRDVKYWIVFACFSVLSVHTVLACDRSPQGAIGSPSAVDDSFQILVDGNPDKFSPGQKYNISIGCNNHAHFISFTLVVEPENGTITDVDAAGHFEIIDKAETRFSDLCQNMLESTNQNKKAHMAASWIAPSNPDGGCVLFRAAVSQHRNVWFLDDGLLTKRLCPEEIDDINSKTPRVDPCCSLDEAKYEVFLERKWSRNTHAKDYPEEEWRAYFSEVIGASHTFDYRFWDYGEKASPGLKEMAEHGSTGTLESEIKQAGMSQSIRTIIKAPPIYYKKNILGTTLANVRVDPVHHLVSLVSKIVPSPDWIIGVAGLELCLANCTWVEQKELNLYPWDVGTDAGPSYMSPDQPQQPADVVRRITSTVPSDARSPFYDESGAPIKPLATLYLTRKRLYGKLTENVPLECATHPWNNWSECSTKCGPGTQTRVRAYKDPALAKSFECQMELTEIQDCTGNNCDAPDNNLDEFATADCEMTPWTEWSSCSKRCGQGYRKRTRTFINPMARDNCMSSSSADQLEQKALCNGEDCGGSIDTGFDRGNNFDSGANAFDQYEFPDNQFSNNAALDRNNRNNYGQSYDRGTYNDNSNLNSLNNGEPGNYLNSNFGNSVSNNQGNVYGNNLISSFGGDSSTTSIYDNNYRGQTESYQSNQGSGRYQSQRPTPSTQNQYGNYESGRRDSIRGYNSNYNTQGSDPSGSRGIYDANGRNSLSVGSVDTDEYNVVQEYCFQMPPISPPPCERQPVVVRNFWFYDASDRQCKIFTSDNCDETKNRFRSLEACEGTCSRPQRNVEQTQSSNMWGSDFGQPQSQVRSRWNNRRHRRSLRIAKQKQVVLI